jgi:hypothetical protein
MTQEGELDQVFTKTTSKYSSEKRFDTVLDLQVPADGLHACCICVSCCDDSKLLHIHTTLPYCAMYMHGTGCP